MSSFRFPPLRLEHVAPARVLERVAPALLAAVVTFSGVAACSSTTATDPGAPADAASDRSEDRTEARGDGASIGDAWIAEEASFVRDGLAETAASTDEPGGEASSADEHSADVLPDATAVDGSLPPSDAAAAHDAIAPDAAARGDAGVGASCTTASGCAAGLLCCYPCGIAGCVNRCTVVEGGCPLYP